MPLKGIKIHEVSYQVTGAGVYGAQSIINAYIVNDTLLPRPYRISVKFFRSGKEVDTKKSFGVLLPKKGTYVSFETYQTTDYAIVSVYPLLRPLPYDEKEVTPT